MSVSIAEKLKSAEIHFKNLEYAKALSLYDQILRKDSKNCEALFEKGKILLELKDLNQAAATFQLGIDLQENTFEKKFPFKFFKAITLANENLTSTEVRTLLEESLLQENYDANEIYLLKALIELNNANFGNALKCLRMTSHTYLKRETVQMLIAYCFLKLNDLTNARLALKRFEKNKEFSAEIDFLEKKLKFSLSSN